uniref:RHS repeat-associated core domain-containing protein n=1 Tax=Herbidospora sakaeratensis TaxID=564415 RepID=UPI000A4E00E6
MASDPTVSRLITVLAEAGPPASRLIQKARAAARERVWKLAGERAPGAGGALIPVDLDATPTSTYTDARGLTTELRQHKSVGYDRTQYGYTPAGQLSSVTDPAGNQWTYTYDLRGRKTQDEDPDKGTTTFTYNDLDQITSTTDARGVTLAYTYDTLGRKTGLYKGSASGAKLADWTYDTLLKGTQTASTRYVDTPNGVQTYVTKVDTYDDAYRPIAQSVVIPSAEGTKLAGTYQYTFGYNVDGTTAQYAIPAAGGLPREQLITGYDELGNPLTTSGISSYVTETRYSSLSQLELIRMRTSATAKQTVRQWNYEAGTNRVQRLATYREVAPIMVSDLNYGYDTAGNITSITNKASPTDAQCFQYDHLRRLTQAWAQGTEGCAATPAQSVVGGPAPYWMSFGYDVTGNRTSEVKHAASGDTTRTYYYPAAGAPRPHGVTAISGGDTYTYDASGNTITRKAGADPQQTLDWDAEGHLSKVTTTAGVTSYLYDADGNRLIRRDPTGTTLYLPDQEIRLTTATNTTTCTRFYTHAGQTVAQRVLGTVTWLASDLQGTASASVVGNDTQTTAVRRQTPFGTSRDATTVVWANEKGFVGGTADPSTSLTHLGAREYDPRAGRFLSVDPVLDIGDPQQMNGYSYAANSPVTFSDPTGLIPADYANGRNGGYRGWQADVAAKQANRPIVPHADYKPIGRYTAHPAAKQGCGTWDFGCKARSVISGAGQWIAEHKTVIISTAVSIGVGALCTTITAGAGAVGCAVLGGMAGRLVSDGMSGNINSLGDALTSAAWGAGEGLLGLGIGKLIGAGASKIGAGFRRAPTRAAPASPTPRAATSCTTNSFTSATLVLLAGGAKPISDVRFGDEVLAADPATGHVEPKPVTALITGTGAKRLVDISVGDAPIITATAGHPFWVPALKTWVPAEELTPGTWLQTASGTYVQVTATAHRTAAQQVHNLTVAGLHTYYVLAGTNPVLVHNCGDASEEVYRVIRPDEDPTVGLMPKDSTAKVSVDEHVRFGSRRDFVSQYISTTKNEAIARGWAARSGNRIVAIDLGKVKGEIIDLSTYQDRAYHLLDWKGRGYAMKSEEVLINGSVPPNAVRVVD